MMRVCEAPALKRPPSEYIREMYFTSQPLEKSNMKLLEATCHAINADTQLLFASDWPHWDFDAPSSITSIPFLSPEAKRNILGLNAARLFNLEVKRMRPRARTSAPFSQWGGVNLERSGARPACHSNAIAAASLRQASLDGRTREEATQLGSRSSRNSPSRVC